MRLLDAHASRCFVPVAFGHTSISTSTNISMAERRPCLVRLSRASRHCEHEALHCYEHRGGLWKRGLLDGAGAYHAVTVVAADLVQYPPQSTSRTHLDDASATAHTASR